MNRRFRLSQAASADLDDIWVYVADAVQSGLRSHPVGNYVIYYREMKSR
jgi:plasmid stabilization system protein ParE